ncbi:MAG: Hpt domain-containing protein [Acidobacteriota bacterium]
MEIDHEVILQTFLTDAMENLAKMEAALVSRETQPDNDELLNTIFRVAHTLKGDAALLGSDSLTGFAHTLEDLLNKLQKRTLSVSAEL